MRNGALRLLFALAASLFVAEASLAQPPGKKRGPGGGLDRVLDDLKLPAQKKETVREAVAAYRDNSRRLTGLASAALMMKLRGDLGQEEFSKLLQATEKARAPFGPGRGPGARRPGGATTRDIVERIMSFDKNKDGKITKDELPERMQNLIARGDLNKDGALDRDEVEKLAAQLAGEESPRRGPGRGPVGRRPPGSELTPAAVERAVAALKLSGKKKETAESALKACKEKVRKLRELARAELLLRMSADLSVEELAKFEAALQRQPGLLDGPVGPPRRPPFPRRGREE
jgi:hypothetical protein